MYVKVISKSKYQQIGCLLDFVTPFDGNYFTGFIHSGVSFFGEFTILETS